MTTVTKKDMPGRRETRPYQWSCGPESIRQLVHGSPFDLPLINMIVYLSDSGQYEFSPVYLGWEIGKEILKPGFGDSRKLVSGITRLRSWIFPIFWKRHYFVIQSSWHQGVITFYDHVNYATLSEKKAIEVSTNPLIRHISSSCRDQERCKVIKVGTKTQNS